jgi:predicted phosphodiesterase
VGIGAATTSRLYAAATRRKLAEVGLVKVGSRSPMVLPIATEKMEARKVNSLRRAAVLWVVVILSIAASPTIWPAEQPTHFYFVQLTDTHVGSADGAARSLQVVNAINRLPMKIECVVHTGDIVNDGAYDAAEARRAMIIFSALNPPVYYAAGNHDILDGDKRQPCIEAFGRYFGPLTSKAEYQGVVFLILYTEPLRNSFSVPGFDPLAWLEQALNDAGDKPVIIFTHVPSAADFYGNEMHSGWPSAAREKWERLISSHNVKAVITGHFHRDELHWMGSVPLYVAPSVAGFWGRQASFRIYEYQDGKIGYRDSYIE